MAAGRLQGVGRLESVPSPINKVVTNWVEREVDAFVEATVRQFDGPGRHLVEVFAVEESSHDPALAEGLQLDHVCWSDEEPQPVSDGSAYGRAWQGVRGTGMVVVERCFGHHCACIGEVGIPGGPCRRAGNRRAVWAWLPRTCAVKL